MRVKHNPHRQEDIETRDAVDGVTTRIKYEISGGRLVMTCTVGDRVMTTHDFFLTTSWYIDPDDGLPIVLSRSRVASLCRVSEDFLAGLEVGYRTCVQFGFEPQRAKAPRWSPPRGSE